MPDPRPTPYEVVVKVLSAMQAGDMDTVEVGIHPNIVVHEARWVPFYGGVHHGRDAFLRDVLAPMTTAYRFTFHQADVLDAGDAVIGLIDLEMTSQQTSRSVRMMLTEIYHVTDGMISQMDIYYKDTVELCAVFPEGLERTALQP